MDNSKELVDDDVIRHNPADEREIGKTAEQIVGDEVPDSRAREDDEEKLFASHSTSTTDTSVVLSMQSVEESTVD